MKRHTVAETRVTSSNLWHLWIVGTLFLALLGPAAIVAAQDAASFAGHWEGAIELPTGELVVKVDLSEENGQLAGTIDIPQQGAAGLPLDGFEINGNGIRFAIKGVPGEPTFSGRLEDGEIRGEFVQGGAKFPFTLGQGDVAPPARPQEPEPPFPYDEQEVTYTSGDITLAGTLTLPKGNGRFPATVLITGSGPQNRDEALLGHKPFLVIADHLTSAGIAVLRVDDRGVGGSTGKVSQSTTADFAADVIAGVKFLEKHERIDPGKVGVIGHSEGAIVGALAASQSKDIAFVVMLAGTGVPGSEVLTRQLEKMAEAEGVPREAINKQLALQKQIIDLLASDKPTEEIEVSFRELVGRQIDLQQELTGNSTEAPREEVIDQAVRRTLNPWFRFFVTYDPRPALTRVRVPVLALNGSLDTQVDAGQNLPEIMRALEAGGNPDVTTEVLPGLNHLFQNAKTGAFSEYALIEETFDEHTLRLIADWILKRSG